MKDSSQKLNEKSDLPWEMCLRIFWERSCPQFFGLIMLTYTLAVKWDHLLRGNSSLMESSDVILKSDARLKRKTQNTLFGHFKAPILAILVINYKILLHLPRRIFWYPISKVPKDKVRKKNCRCMSPSPLVPASLRQKLPKDTDFLIWSKKVEFVLDWSKWNLLQTLKRDFIEKDPPPLLCL